MSMPPCGAHGLGTRHAAGGTAMLATTREQRLLQRIQRQCVGNSASRMQSLQLKEDCHGHSASP